MTAANSAATDLVSTLMDVKLTLQCAPIGEGRLALATAAGVAEVDAADAVVAEAHGEAVGHDEAAGGEHAGHGHLVPAEPHQAVEGAAVQEIARLHLPAPEHDGRLQGLPGGGGGARALPGEVEHVLHQHPKGGGVGGHVLDLVRAAAIGRGGAGVGTVAQRVVARHLLARRRPSRAVGAEPRRGLPGDVGDGRALLAVARHPEEVAAGLGCRRFSLPSWRSNAWSGSGTQGKRQFHSSSLDLGHFGLFSSPLHTVTSENGRNGLGGKEIKCHGT